MTKAEKVEALNANLKAASDHLYKLNLGIEGRVSLYIDEENGVTTFVRWGQFRGQWQLLIEEDDGFEGGSIKPLLEATVFDRRAAAHKLPDLLKELRAKADRELIDIDDAAAAAAAFARGDHDAILFENTSK